MASYPQLLVSLQNTPPPAGSIEKIYGLMLYGAMRNKHPQNVIEFGTGAGYSTAWILLGLEENESGHLWSVDVMPSDDPIWKRVNVPETRLTYFSNDPVISVKNKLPPTFDFVFHDAGHSWDEVKADLDWILPRLSVGGSLVVHDVAFSKAMGEGLLEYFDSRPDEWTYERIEEGCGVGIATRIKATEIEACKDALSGSTIRKGSDSSQEKMAKIISPTSRKSNKRRVAARSPKISMSPLSPSQSKRGRGRKRLSLSGVA